MNFSQLSTVIIKEIENCSVPWQKDYTASKIKLTRPYNPITNTVYKGANFLNLYLNLCFRNPDGIEDFRFCTFNQAKENSLKIKKGSKSFTIIYYQHEIIDDEDDEKHVRYCTRYYNVFNFSDMEIPDDSKYKEIVESDSNLFESVDYNINSIIEKLKVKIYVKENYIPEYVPSCNYIIIPTDFVSDNIKNSTVFHEIVHWTADNIESCKRKLDYAQEELVAEIGSFMICQYLGINYTHAEKENYYAYLKGWLSKFSDDEKLDKINTAVHYATKAYNSIISAV